MTALIDGVLVTGTPEEIVELLDRRNAVPVPVTTGGNWPPCTCMNDQQTAGCMRHPYRRIDVGF